MLCRNSAESQLQCRFEVKTPTQTDGEADSQKKDIDGRSFKATPKVALPRENICNETLQQPTFNTCQDTCLDTTAVYDPLLSNNQERNLL